MAKEELKEQNKVSMFEFAEVSSALVEQKKRELADLHHNLLLATSSLTATQQQIAKDKVAFEQWKKATDAIREKELQKKEQAFDAKLHALDINVQNFEKRSAELKKREMLAANVIEDRNKLNIDRIEVERLRHRAEELMDSANKEMSRANRIINEANAREEQVKKLEQKINDYNEQISKREASVEAREKDVAMNLRNLEEIRKELGPKLA